MGYGDSGSFSGQKGSAVAEVSYFTISIFAVFAIYLVGYVSPEGKGAVFTSAHLLHLYAGEGVVTPIYEFCFQFI